ncbi:MAG: hypothetical protein B7O98_00420 [Zestosphaera tikiterensis]|uniref:Uncharacterized protein n=1 Tax=Zestosphaera tikiterensis TaxID=1973259 RepID=A0A2R7Y9C1_9CREN|nr:MAG: hypothetical protein B7O98_00420 [Zestosphaera tikiterensis]
MKWVKYINPTDGDGQAFGTCVFGDYVAALGSTGGKPYVALLSKSDGSVVREWKSTDSWAGWFINCVSINGKLYVIGNPGIYVFDADLNILANIKVVDLSDYFSLAHDGKALYVGGWVGEDVNGDGEKEAVWLVEKRDPRDLSLISSKKIYVGSWKGGTIYDIDVEPFTGRIWTVGGYADSKDTEHSLIAVLDSDLEVLKVIDYPDGSEGYVGGFNGVAFDGKGYVYASGILGIAKFSLDGELVAVNRDVERAPKIVYGYDHLHAFRVEYIKACLRHVLYIYDTNLSLVKKYVLSESIDADSYFNVHGRPTLEESNIYVVSFDKALGEGNLRFVVYFLQIESTPASETMSTVATTSPTVTTAATTGLMPQETSTVATTSATQVLPGIQLGVALAVIGVIAAIATVAVFVPRKR